MRQAGTVRAGITVAIAAVLAAGMPAAQARTAPSQTAPTTPACRTYAAQRTAELAALDLMKTPDMQRARAAAEARWRQSWGPISPEMEAAFPQALDELMFNAALKTVVNATYPATMTMGIDRPGRYGDIRIPGTRYGWDNTDNIYGSIPVDPRATYRLSGRMTDPGTNLNLSVWAKDGTVLSNLAKADIRADAEGHFSLTVGMGEGFDLKLPPNAHHIMIRETMPDWATGQPIYIDVMRTSGPAPEPVSVHALARAASTAVEDTIDKMQAWRQSLYRKYPANQFVTPWMGRNDNGGLPNQALSIGHYALADDEAVVFDIALGGAAYFSFQSSDIWGTSGNFVDNVSTLTNKQSHANADGSFTYVVSIKDPGVQNWISTQGWHEGDVTLRWQQITASPGTAAGPDVKVRRIKLADLPAVLPAGTPRFTTTEREAQIAARARNPFSLWRDASCATGKVR